MFKSVKGSVKAVDGITVDVRRGETLGLVGESGCGKSTIGRAMIRLRDATGGSVRFDGVDLFSLKPDELRKYRRRMQIIFQDPYGSLDPRMTVSAIVSEPIETHDLATGAAKDERVAELLSWSASTRSTSSATRTSSRAGSASASASRARSRSSPSSSSATSRSRRSTCRSRPRSSTC